MRTVSRLIAPTLGPRARTVVVAPITAKSPEVLDNAGLIARRLLELPDRSDDVGALYVRGVLWDIYKQTGDGVATASVLFQAVLDAADRHLAAGVNAQQLRDALLWGLDHLLGEIGRITAPVTSPETLRQVAKTMSGSPDLAATIGDIMSVAGMFGRIEVRKGHGERILHEFIDGAYWKSAPHAISMLSDAVARRIDIQRCVVFVSDLDLEDERQVSNLIAIARGTGAGGLLIVARAVSTGCVATILANSTPEFRICSVRTPELRLAPQVRSLDDLEVLTGARTFHAAAGASLDRVTARDLGSARYVWADHAYFGIIRPGGNPVELRRYVESLKARFAGTDDLTEREQLVQRIALLSGQCAVMWVQEPDLLTAERTTESVRLAIQGGVVPGGGAALLACRHGIERLLAETTDGPRRAALLVLQDAVEAPARTLIENGGGNPGPPLASALAAGPGYGWDWESGAVANMADQGILDPALVTTTAVRKAVAGAAQALTIETLVHRRLPEQTMDPV